MPLPFLAWGAIVAVTGAVGAVATSEECNRCGDTFWSSDCNYYCDSCCRKRRNEAKEKAAKETAREKEKEEHNRRVREKIERYRHKRTSSLDIKYNECNILKNSISELKIKSSELAQLRKELEVMKDEILA